MRREQQCGASRLADSIHNSFHETRFLSVPTPPCEHLLAGGNQAVLAGCQKSCSAGWPGSTCLLQRCATASESSVKQCEWQANPPSPLLVPKLTSSATSNGMESLNQVQPGISKMPGCCFGNLLKVYPAAKTRFIRIIRVECSRFQPGGRQVIVGQVRPITPSALKGRHSRCVTRELHEKRRPMCRPSGAWRLTF